MAGGATGRGRAGKFNKHKRGGGKSFSRNLRPLDENGNPIKLAKDSDEADSEEESEEEEDSESDDSTSNAKPKGGAAPLTREERRAKAKAVKDAKRAAAGKSSNAANREMPTDSSAEDDSSEDDSSEDENDTPANPNHSRAAANQVRAPTSVSTDKPAAGKPGAGKPDMSNLSRREREAVEAQQARERYMKLHMEGKTDEARADLARLALVKERREAEAARKTAEKLEKEKAESDRKQEIDERERKRRDAAMGTSGKKKGKK